MKISRQETGKSTATITITVEPADIKDKYNNSLKDYSAKAQIKGFRKGKTPVNFIKKMHGHAILADTINNFMQDKLVAYIEDEKLDLIGQPIPSLKDEENVELDPFNLQETTFNFDIGIAPAVEVRGADQLGTYTKYKVVISDELLSEEIDNGARRLGAQEHVDTQIEDNDMVSVAAVELDGKSVKEGGHETTFTILTSTIVDEIAKANFLKSKKGDSIDFDIYTLENGKTENYVSKYLLNLDDGDDASSIGRMFRGEIVDVKRVIPATKDADFFKQLVGDDTIETEEQVREVIKNNISKYYEKESDNLLKGRLASDLIDANPIEFPEEFMKRWIQVASENAQTINLDEEYQAYAKQLQWTIIKNGLMKAKEIEVTPDEIKAAARERVLSYFGGAGGGINEEMIEGIIPRLLNDQAQLQQIYSSVEFDKLMTEVAKDLKTETKNVNIEEFKDVVEQYNEEMATKNS